MRTRALVVLMLVLVPLEGIAQTSSPPAVSAGQESLLKPEQLEALAAPIALYPDTLLAQVLMAATYPLEVVQAERWVTEHKNLEGDQLKKEVEKQPWDESVKSLLATPSVLTMMSKKLDWTQKLGDAVLAQEADVMDAVQRLRSKAYASDKLKSSKEQKVTVRQENNKQIVTIAPTDPNTIYVPYYDPAIVYGSWPYPDYPPYYYYPDEGYLPGGVIGTGIAFGAGYALWRWASGGRFWGGRVNWGGGRIDINRGAHVEHWRHNPQHRRGVAYNNANVRQKFAGNTNRTGNNGQLNFRGNDGKQVVKPGAGGKVSDRRQPNKQARHGNRSKEVVKPGGDRRQPNKQARQATKETAQAHRPSQNRAARRAPAQRSASRHAHRGPSHARSGRSFGYAPRGHVRMGGRGGGGFRGGRGGGRRSDIRVKHDIVLLGRLENGLGFYRFTYNGGRRRYVGVMAQEVQQVLPSAVTSDREGYLRVDYSKLGVRFQPYDQWKASGAIIRSGISRHGLLGP
jgi:Protein of unknown function (DUF3300)/Chaperone of endosialidase